MTYLCKEIIETRHTVDVGVRILFQKKRFKRKEKIKNHSHAEISILKIDEKQIWSYVLKKKEGKYTQTFSNDNILRTKE